MVKKLMVATDLIQSDDAAVSKAVEICRHFNATLVLLHVLESGSIIDRRLVKHYGSGEEIRADAQYERQAEEALRKCHDHKLSTTPALDVQIRIETGFPWEEIVRRAKAERVDLILLGPHSQRAEQKGVVRIAGRVGSTAQGVIMDQPCPVMIVHSNTLDSGLDFKHILVGIDFSHSCLSAFNYALKLAGRYDSCLTLFHMLPVPPSAQYTQVEHRAKTEAIQRRLKELLTCVPHGIECDLQVRGGVHPHLEITRLVARLRIDLILLGSHTKERGGKWYVGSVVERTSHRARCPVMVVSDHRVAGIT
jgi:nucleotide-binding universal stress UspA family protein